MIQANLDTLTLTPGMPDPAPTASAASPATSAASPTKLRRARGRFHFLVVAAILGILTGSWMLSYLLRFDFAVPDLQAAYMALTLPFMLVVFLLSLYANRVFRILRTYVAVHDALTIGRGTAMAAVLTYVLSSLLLPPGAVPRSILLFHAILTPVGICTLFLAFRLVRERRMRAEKGEASAAPALIVGAGDSGDALMREIERIAPPPVRVLGFLDDDPAKQGGLLRGVPVLGGTGDLLRLANELSIRQVLVALPGVGGETLRPIVGPLIEQGIQVKVLPSIVGLLLSEPLLPQLKNVAIEDLLRREPVRVDDPRSKEYLRGRRVLVTGAAGSIGMELCRQILRYQPSRLVALDCAETPLHDLMLEIGKGLNPGIVFPELGDVTDPVRLKALFAKYQPDVVFHAAALKHVPVCEDHPREAVRVNVGGTKNVALQAMQSGVGLFILISTDKAVNPSSVMGATKRCAELLLQDLSEEAGTTRFAAVRFGNVLGSNGSVLKIFKSQIEKGGPLTVTHPEMRRYFMTIPEAVELVLQAAFMADGGEIFELDMGSPVKIVDLAEDFIRLSGRTPGQDVKIQFTGIRPGEKLFEELYCHQETIAATSHPKVFCLKSSERSGGDPAVRKVLNHLGDVQPDSDPTLAELVDDLQVLAGESVSSAVTMS